MNNANEPQSEARLTIRVAVGSSNPCKIGAAKTAFEEIFATATIVMLSYNVPSGKRECRFVVT